MNPPCAPTAVPNTTTAVAALRSHRHASRSALSAPNSGTSHATSSLHRFDVLERQLCAQSVTCGVDNTPTDLLQTHRREPLPPTVASDLMRITKRFAQDPDLMARMTAIVMEERPCDEIEASQPHGRCLGEATTPGSAFSSRDESDCASPYDVVSLHHSPNVTQRLATNVLLREGGGGSNTSLSSPNQAVQRRLPLTDGRSPAKIQSNAKQVFLQDSRRGASRDLMVSCASESNSTALVSSVEGKDMRIESQRADSEDALEEEEGSEAATDTLQQLLDQETEEFDRICAMTFTRIPAPQSSDGELIGLCDTTHEEGGEEQSSASIDTPRSASGTGGKPGCSAQARSPHSSLNYSEVQKRTPTSTNSQMVREPSRFQVPKLSLSKLEARSAELILPEDICQSVTSSSPAGNVATMEYPDTGNEKHEDPRWLAVSGEVKRSTPYIVGAALGSSLKTAAAAIKHSVKYLWSTACSMFNVDFEVPVPPIALGPDAAGAKESNKTAKSQQRAGAGASAGAELVAVPPSTARVPVRNMERKHIDQRFYLAGAMLINASLMWAVANKVKPSRLIEPLVDVLQRAFFTAIY